MAPIKAAFLPAAKSAETVTGASYWADIQTGRDSEVGGALGLMPDPIYSISQAKITDLSCSPSGSSTISAAYGRCPDSLEESMNLDAEIAAVFDLPELRLIFLNESGRRRLDRELTLELIDFTLPDLLGVGTIEQFHSEILLRTRVFGHWAGEWELRDAWGSPFSAEITLTRRRDGLTEYLCFHATSSEHSDQNTNANVADRELLHVLMHSAPDAIYFKDRDSRFLRISRAMAHRFNLKEPREAIGKTDFDYFSVEHASEAFKAEQLILKTGLPLIDLEEEETWPDGRTTWVSTTKMPLHDAQGDIVGTFGISRDITVSKILAKERRDLEVRLQLNSKLESIGRLAAGVAHEINTPTQYLVTNTQFLDQHFEDLARVIQTQKALREAVEGSPLPTDPAVQLALLAVREAEIGFELDYLMKEIPLTVSQSLEGLERVARIVRSLKELCHSSSAEQLPVDLNQVIENAFIVSRHEWKYVAELVTDLDRELPPTPCVADQIGQVMVNLLVNAAHAISETLKPRNRERGRITVRTRRCGEEAVAIEVQDDGSGIPEDVRRRIFEPFFTTKPIGKGTGQGLALVKTIVETNHHGVIEVETRVGTGTTFRLLLPVTRRAISPAAPAASLSC